jgi:hypothetical protein
MPHITEVKRIQLDITRSADAVTVVVPSENSSVAHIVRINVPDRSSGGWLPNRRNRKLGNISLLFRSTYRRYQPCPHREPGGKR